MHAASCLAAVALASSSTTGCGCGAAPSESGGGDPSRPGSSTSADACPSTLPAPDPLPGVAPRHRTLAYWLERIALQGDLDEVLLDPDDIDDHNRALEAPFEGHPLAHTDLVSPVDRESVLEEMSQRLTFLAEQGRGGVYLDSEGAHLDAAALDGLELPEPVPAFDPILRVARDLVPLRCGPREAGLYTESLDLAFDRNNCSTARAQEPVQLLARWPNGMWLARTAYSLGWVAADAALSPPLSAADAQRWLGMPRGVVRQDLELDVAGERLRLSAGTSLPVEADRGSAMVASARGVEEVSITTDRLLTSRRPLTRRALFETAFGLLDAPYGWGGQGGGRDCSRFLLDVFGTFDIELPRHSGRQARAGDFSLDVAEVEDEREKVQLIEAAARRGIALLHFPGHIMLYLGQTESGTPMALHSFAEYVEPCGHVVDERSPGESSARGESAETLRTVNKVTVSDLSLGRGSSRRSFIERLTRITVIGNHPGADLIGAAELREPATVSVPSESACSDGVANAIFRSPRVPNAEQPLRVIATLRDDPGPVGLWLVTPNGELERQDAHHIGGPPSTFWSRIERPRPGRYTAVVGDGHRIVACERFGVLPSRPAPEPRTTLAAWEPRFRWEEDTENLYAAFVEQLFDYPVEEDVTWPDLQTLLRDRVRNLLYDHLSRQEDEAIALGPDCADLPYFLRAYFAWKTSLPFAYRNCSRGRAGQPPTCGQPHDNTNAIGDGETVLGEVQAFAAFMRQVKQAAHSASARTGPADDQTDVYPIPLTRSALRPGTVYADPYGHLLVIADWLPQGIRDYGVMMGADAQPDGTIGRRRFWRGSFLFTPDTTDAGAGFKAWRPVEFDRATGTVTVLDNRALTASTVHTPYALDQYQGSADDFYARMEALINPRPLNPSRVLTTLIDALHESIARRIVSINNGLEHSHQTGWAIIAMPTGHDVFETAGPWEDFSTPARDMRLLISVDAVSGFPETVAAQPERFGIDSAGGAAAAAALRAELTGELPRRRFSYQRSDGSQQELSLADVVARREGFEMAYNPNDCVEVRWAAPEDSAERSTCRHRAPRDQQTKMQQYRSWFQERRRPAR